MIKHVKIIVNPAAGAGKTVREWPQIKYTLSSMGLRFEDDMTESPGHAVELAKSAANDGYELVVSVGGDGTLHEVVNGLYEANGLGDITLGIISTGTGSDYIRTVKVPHKYDEVCRSFLKPIQFKADLGIVEYRENGAVSKRSFVNFAGIGFDAEVVKATTRKFKAAGSTISYLLGVLSTFLSYRNRKVAISIDSMTSDRKICTVIVSHGKYGGGGMLVAPQADPTDGLLDVTIIDDIKKIDFLRSLPRIYDGTHLTHPKVSATQAKEIILNPIQSMPLQADGELLGETPARFYVLPGALSIAI